jgi:hypothetical protein
VEASKMSSAFIFYGFIFEHFEILIKLDAKVYRLAILMTV